MNIDARAYPLPSNLALTWSLVSRPLRASFGISRGSKNYALSLRVELRADGVQGFGESVPYARYGEQLAVVRERMQAVIRALAQGQPMLDILDELPGGCVREAIDAARWDFLCKKRGVRIRDLLGLPSPRTIQTCYTVSLSDPASMAKQARELVTFRVLKLKLGGGDQDVERVAQVAKARPDARLIADVNEGWTPANCEALATRCKAAGLSLIEQPLPSDDDAALGQRPRPLPCFADESVHGVEGLSDLVDRYDGINVKLGKCGGVDRGLELIAAARALGLKVMVGCMVGSSRSIAPALVLAALADEVDLDAHLWLAKDLHPSLEMQGDEILSDFSPALWG